jgi:hypothetical protein
LGVNVRDKAQAEETAANREEKRKNDDREIRRQTDRQAGSIP